MKFSSAFSLLLATSVMAAQDSAYYPGFSNPNTEDEMYYREAVNVIQDLQAGVFDSLYISYHGCVWSEYGNGADNGDNGDAGCGEDGGEDYWYLGNTQCFRANVAYSLYGVKSGKSSSNPCKKSHYINSFFTTGGIESFGDYAGIDYEQYGATTSCEAQDGDEEEGNNNNNNYNGQMYGGTVSTGLGCSAQGNFITATFQGSYCDGNYFLKKSADFSYLNADLQELSCMKIYDVNGNQDDDYVEDEENEGGSQDQNDIDLQNSAEGLLYYSAACSHVEYPNRCPDPHGVKKSRDMKLFNYADSKFRAVPLIMPILSTLFFFGAVVFYCLGNGIRDAARRREMVRNSEKQPDLTVYEHFSHSFHSFRSVVSTKTRSFAEGLAAYAEEEEVEDEIEPAVADSMVGSYTSPTAPTKEEEAAADSVKSAAASVARSDAATRNQKEVADAMLSEKGVTPKKDGTAPSGKKYKRPRMARISRWFRRRFGRKTATSS